MRGRSLRGCVDGGGVAFLGEYMSVEERENAGLASSSRMLKNEGGECCEERS